MGLVSYNKRFLAATVNAPGSTHPATVNAPGSTHDATLLRHTFVFNVVSGRALPDKTINLGDEYGEIPQVTIGNSAFPRYQWLLKCFPNTTKDVKEKHFSVCGILQSFLLQGFYISFIWIGQHARVEISLFLRPVPSSFFLLSDHFTNFIY